jgi:methionyl aminopeptidase
MPEYSCPLDGNPCRDRSRFGQEPTEVAVGKIDGIAIDHVHSSGEVDQFVEVRWPSRPHAYHHSNLPPVVPVGKLFRGSVKPSSEDGSGHPRPDTSAIISAVVTIDGDDDLQGLLRAATVVKEARQEMATAVRPGITTGELDAIGRDVFRRHGARSAPRVTYRFPGATCISVNDEAAHGVPSLARRLREGDLVNLDVSAELDGFFSDTGVSVPVGSVSPVADRLLAATRRAQGDAMEAAQPGAMMREVGRAVQRRARRHGFCVIHNLCGHGIGRGLHEPPSVPSVDDGQRTRLHEGLVLAVEPFLSVSSSFVVDDPDRWTLRTSDGSLVAQHEHTMVVTVDGPLVLTK